MKTLASYTFVRHHGWITQAAWTNYTYPNQCPWPSDTVKLATLTQPLESVGCNRKWNVSRKWPLAAFLPDMEKIRLHSENEKISKRQQSRIQDTKYKMTNFLYAGRWSSFYQMLKNKDKFLKCPQMFLVQAGWIILKLLKQSCAQLGGTKNIWIFRALSPPLS